VTEYGSGRLGNSLIDKQDRDVVSNRISSPTLSTLQALALILENKRFLADWADQDVEQILRNHRSDFTPVTKPTKALAAGDAHTAF